MEIIQKKVGDLVPYENNPRKNENAVEYVAKSIQEFGFLNPIIIDEENIIIAGHTRLLAAEKLGIDVVPCVMVSDLTEDQIKAYRIADNKANEFAEWDWAKLEIELAELQFADIDFDLGFDIDSNIDFMDFDGIGDGGGSMINTGTKVRVVVGAAMCDIDDPTHEIYEKTKDIDADVLAAWMTDKILNGEIKE